MLDFGFYNMDCMHGMKEFPDKFFDLAIVDPPYRNENDPMQWMRRDAYKSDRKMKNFGSAPDCNYFKELFRVSKNQIIWGGQITLIFRQRKDLLFGTKGFQRV